jgi:hypothetical protein
MHKLEPSQHDKLLYFRLEGEAAERHGSLGYLRVDFSSDGRHFYSTWFDCQPHLKTPAFREEFDTVINSLRNDGDNPPFASRRNLQAYLSAVPGKDLTTRGKGYFVETLDYSYYFRCKPSGADYDVYAFAFDNRWLLPELAGKHALPDVCYSILPSTGEVIMIKPVSKGYFPANLSTADPAVNRVIANTQNEFLGVTRAQEEACLAGSLFGWGTPTARPWKYDQDGKPRQPQPKKDEPER